VIEKGIPIIPRHHGKIYRDGKYLFELIKDLLKRYEE